MEARTGSASERLRLDDVALRCDDEDYDVADVVLLALAEGMWQEMEDRLACGVALEDEQARTIEPAGVAAEVTRFRYEHRLIAARELRDWLAARGLVLGDLQRHCLRRLLVGNYGTCVDRIPAHELDAREVHAELICSGTLAGALRRLGDVAAMAATAPDTGSASAEERAALIAQAAAHEQTGLSALGDEELERRAARILSLLRAEAAFIQTTATPDSVRRWLTQHRVDSLRVECSELALRSEGAAREALLCLRVDGTSLVALSEQLATGLQSRVYYVGELDDRAGPRLASAPIGAPVGPLQAPDGWRVVVVDARVPPRADDPVLVARATAAIVQTARARVKAGRVRELAAF